MIAPLKQRSFLMLYLSQVLSDLGNWFDFIAIGMIIAYRWKLGAGALAMQTIAMGAPWIMLGPVLSVYTERLPKRTLLALCHICRGLVAAGLIFTPNLWLMLVLVFIKETIGAIYDPPVQSAIQFLVPKELLPEANSLLAVSSYTSKILAPVLGGLIISWSGPKLVFLIETTGFLLGAFFIFKLPVFPGIPTPTNEGEPRADARVQNAWKEFKAGWDYIVTTRIIRLAVFFSATRLFLIFLYDSMLILWAKNLHIQESVYGLLVSACGVGSVIGALAAGHWKHWEPKPLESICWATILSGGLVTSFGFIGYGFHYANLYLLIGLFFISGLTGAIIPVANSYILQTETTPGVLGRVVGAVNGIQNLFMLTAPGLGALLAKIWGINPVFLISGLGTALLGVFVITRCKIQPGGKELKEVGQRLF